MDHGVGVDHQIACEGTRSRQDQGAGSRLGHRAGAGDRIGHDEGIAPVKHQHRIVGDRARSEGSVGAAVTDQERASTDSGCAVAVRSREQHGAVTRLGKGSVQNLG